MNSSSDRDWVRYVSAWNFAKILLFTPAKEIDEALASALAKVGTTPKIILIPQGSLTVPIHN